MSRIGLQPIAVPAGVTVDVSPGEIRVKGPKGELVKPFHPDMRVVRENDHLVIQRPTDSKEHRSLHGLTRSLIQNMVVGVTAGYEKRLDITGTGFRSGLSGRNLTLSVGYSHPIEVVPRDGITFEAGVDQQTRTPFILVRGIDKQLVGQQAAEVRSLKKPEPYKGKGIRYAGEQIRRKAGKSGKAGGAKKK